MESKNIEDVKMKITFPQETLQEVVDTFTPDVERIATLCIAEDNSIYLGEPVKKGTRYRVPSITKDEMVCPSGTKPIGTIHSHLEDYSERPPFDKGFSNEDIFSLAKEALNKSIDLPYLGCVLSPTFDNRDRWNGLRIDCEYYKPFTEEDIKKMPNGIVHSKNGKKERETFDDQQINAIKYGDVPTGTLRSLGFIVAMANLKIGLKERGFMEQGTITMPVRNGEVNTSSQIMELK